jgi:DNA-directed RNA polymerase subunit RPC12/RpoP
MNKLICGICKKPIPPGIKQWVAFIWDDRVKEKYLTCLECQNKVIMFIRDNIEIL